MLGDEQVLVLDGSESRRVAAVLRWQHRSGSGWAHCLGRLLVGPVAGAARAPVAVLSELAVNPGHCGLAQDPAGAAAVFLARMGSYAVLDPLELTWMLHHGSLSSFDRCGGPETFTVATLQQRNGELWTEPAQCRALGAADVAALIAPLELHPMAEVLTELRSVRI